MVLLDEILDYDDESLQGRATIREDHVFLRPEGVVPAWMAMEILAQGIAAFDGCHAVQAGRGPQLGFLLGSRKFSLYVDSLPVGAELQVNVCISTSSGQGFGVFDGELHWMNAPEDIQASLPQGSLVAAGALNVYQPGEAGGLAGLVGIQGS
jgi:hypothetical protein